MPRTTAFRPRKLVMKLNRFVMKRRSTATHVTGTRAETT
jgi:hypothetical protein